MEAAQPEHVAGVAGASPAPRRFGEAGEFVLTSDFVTSVDFLSYAGTPSSSVAVNVAPGVDYFVLNHVAVGVAAEFSYGSVTALDPTAQAEGIPIPLTVTTTNKSIGIAPRVALDIPLGVALSVYVRADVAFGVGAVDERSVTSENSDSYTFVTAGLFAPLLVHPAQHLFVGLGPSLSHDLSRTINESGYSNRATTLGAGLVVGAWL